MATAADEKTTSQQQPGSTVPALGPNPGSDAELWAAQTMTFPTANEVKRKRPKKESNTSLD